MHVDSGLCHGGRNRQFPGLPHHHHGGQCSQSDQAQSAGADTDPKQNRVGFLSGVLVVVVIPAKAIPIVAFACRPGGHFRELLAARTTNGPAHRLLAGMERSLTTGAFGSPGHEKCLSTSGSNINVTPWNEKRAENLRDLLSIIVGPAPGHGWRIEPFVTVVLSSCRPLLSHSVHSLP